MKTYKDIYEFPLRMIEGCNFVQDNKGQFVFQFEFDDEKIQNQVLDVINTKENFTNPDLIFFHKDGYIEDNSGGTYILIRGCGNLTGTGGHNLSPEEAANIQDTFAEYIVKQLNKRNT